MDLEPSVVQVTILNTQNQSSVGDLVLGRLSRIDFGSGWTAAPITLRASEDGVTFRDVFLDTAEYVVTTAGALRSVIINAEVAYDVRYWIIRSGTSAAPVAQGGDRVLQLVTASQ